MRTVSRGGIGVISSSMFIVVPFGTVFLFVLLSSISVTGVLFLFLFVFGVSFAGCVSLDHLVSFSAVID